MKIQKRGLVMSGIITGADKEGRPLHTFAVCAYKDSPYLEACIRSLTEQQVKTDVICCTSTPSPYIEKITKKYAVPLYVREGESNIREDWLFAWHKAGGRLVTIAHQDDVYRLHDVKDDGKRDEDRVLQQGMAGEEDSSDAAPAEIAVRSAAGKTKQRYLRQFALLSGLYVSEGAGGGRDVPFQV